MYYLVSYDGVIELQQDEPEVWQEQYFTIYTNELEAYKYAYDITANEQEDIVSNLIADKNRQIVELLWKYEPDSLNKLPPWWSTLVSDVTKGEVIL